MMHAHECPCCNYAQACPIRSYEIIFLINHIHSYKRGLNEYLTMIHYMDLSYEWNSRSNSRLVLDITFSKEFDEQLLFRLNSFVEKRP